MTRHTRNDYLPLTPLQQGIVLAETGSADSSGAYVLQLVADCGPELDVERLRRSCERLLQRYPNLRAAFRQRANGEWVQIVPPHASVPWERTTLGQGESGAPADRASVEDQLEELGERDRQRPFDLGSGPLLRATLVTLPDGSHRFLLAMHHGVIDGWSVRLLIQELVTGYLEPAASTEEDRTFRRYLAWLGGADRAAARAAWTEALTERGGATLLSAVAPGGVVDGRAEGRLEVTVPAEELGLTQVWLRHHGLTLTDAVNGAWALVLAQVTGRSDVVFGMVDSGRSAPVPAVETAVGLLANTVPVRVRVDSRASVREHVARIHDTQLALLEHRHAPLLEVQGAAGGGPLFDTLVTSLGYFETTETTVDAAEMGLRSVDVHTGSDHAATLTVIPGTSLVLRLQYQRQVVADHVAALMLDQVAAVVRGCPEWEDELVSRIPLTPVEQQAEVLDRGRGPDALGTDVPIADLVVADLLSRPDVVALTAGAEDLTGGVLAERVSALARLLIAEGVGPESVVGIACPRVSALVQSMVAVLAAGGAYLPLDTHLPPQRLADMLQDAPPQLVLGLRDDLDRLAGAVTPLEVRTIALDDPDVVARLSRQRTDPVEACERTAVLHRDHPAYLIFTSGSTGRPKAVVVTQGGLVNIALDYVERVELGADSRLLAVTTFGFDIAMTELLTPLMTGGTLVIADEATTKDPESLGRLVRSSGATHMQATPVHWRSLETVAGECLDGLRIVTGGEALPRSLAQRLHGRGVRDLHNLYGPTETTIWSTAALIERGWAGAPSIGRPMAGNDVLVLDNALRPVAPGVPGELYLAGRGMARGYLARPGLTSTRFVANPYGSPGSRMYRTGDVAKWGQDGTVDFLGRVDHQIKIRGLRIEVGEIESVLGECPGVVQSVVVAERPVEDADFTLVGFLETDGTVDGPEEVVEHLSRRLPAHMIPGTIVLLDRMPLTASGKVDRGSLPRVRREVVAPRSATETMLMDAFAEVLGRPVSSVEDDFFALGGHSLLASILVGRLRRLLGVELSVRTLFEAPSVAALAAVVEQLDRSGSRPSVRSHGLSEGPLSAVQQRMWMLSRVMTGGVYNEPLVTRLVGRLDVEALRAALEDVADRHPVLRTVHPISDRAPVQVVRRSEDGPHWPLEVVDRTDPADVDDLIAERACRDFDLECETPARAVLIPVAEDEHILLALFNHVATDGWSEGVLARDLSLAYAARCARSAPAWPTAQAFSYLDYALWQRELLGDPSDPASLAFRERKFWARTLTDLPVELALPWDRPRPAVASGRGGSVPLRLDAALHAAVADCARAHSVTPFIVLQATLVALLSRLGAGQDIVLGTAVAGRTDDALLEVVGMFVNTLALRTDVSGDPTFVELLDRAKETNLSAIEHQNLPFDAVVDLIDPPRSAARTPLFQIALVLQNTPDAVLRLPGVEMRPYDLPSTTAKLDLALELTESWAADGAPAGIAGILEYNADLADDATVARFGERFVRLLRQAVAVPRTRVSALPLLSEAERERLLAAGTGPDPRAHEVGGPRNLPDRFTSVAAHDPTHAAVRWDGPAGVESMSFLELRARSSRLARELIALGCGPGDTVAMLLPRSPQALVAVLGILASGAAYVPVDPAHPADRVRHALGDIEASAVVTTRDLVPALPGAPGPVPVVLDDPATVDRVSRRSPAPVRDVERWRALLPGDPAYVIYTSGSTGRPKGVVVSQRSALELADSHSRRFATGPSTRVLQFASLGFDAAYWELAVSVLSGATAVIAPEDGRVGAGLARTLRRHGVTLAVLPPVALGSVPSSEQLPAPLTLLVAGEACPPELVSRFGQDSPMLNAYGPTEATVCASVSDVLTAGTRPPIGRPATGHRLRVLDDRLEVVPAGATGELYIGGSGLALGYHGRAALTASRFVADPFDCAGGRMYRTGDLVRWLPDGQLEFLGRSDTQVKVNGQRIELGEIEAGLLAQAGVGQAVTVVREDRPGLREIVAYAVPEAGAQLTGSVLRARLRETLPSSMVPSSVVVLPELPATLNGKVDATRLPSPVHGPVTGRPPTTSAERAACRQFGTVLARDVLDVDADFFELGGNSMQAVELAAALSEVGLRTDLAAVMHLRTPAAVAAAAAATGAALPSAAGPSRHDATAPMLILREGGELAPVFCIHGGFGLAVRFAQLAALLPQGRPVLGLQSPAVDPAAPLPDSLEEVAAQYADAIMARHPEGPYHLAGWSYGGLVAHEVAVQLESRGAEVASLCIIDAFPFDPVADAAPRTEEQLLVGVLEHFEVPADGVPDGLTVGEAVRRLREGDRFPSGLDDTLVRRLVELMLRHSELVTRFTPGHFSGDVDLVVSTHGAIGPDVAQARVRSWAGHIGGEVRTLHLDVSHEDLLDAAPAASIAAAMSRSLSLQVPSAATPRPVAVPVARSRPVTGPASAPAIERPGPVPGQRERPGISLPPEAVSPAQGAPGRWARTTAQLGALTWRRLRHVLTAPGRLVGVVMNPLVMLIAVGYLFKDAIKLPAGSTDYVGFLMPGVLLQVGLASIGPTAITVSADVRSGLMDRFRSMPISRGSVVLAHVLADTVVGIGALVVVALTGLALGWRLSVGPGAVLAGLGLLVLFVMSMVALGVVLGLVMRRAESIDSVGALILVICSFLSSVVLEPGRLPAWIRPVSQWNPVSLVVDQTRRWWGVPVDPTYSVEPPPALLVAGMTALVLLLLAIAVRRFAPRTGTQAGASVVHALLRQARRTQRIYIAATARQTGPTGRHVDRANRRSRTQEDPMSTTQTPSEPAPVLAENEGALGRHRLRRRFTTTIATWSATHPGRAITVWLIVVAATGALGTLGAPRQATQLELGVGESGRADSMAASAGYIDRATENVLITSRDGARLDTRAAMTSARQIARDVRALPLVRSVSAPVPSADGSAVVVQAQLEDSSDEAVDHLAPLARVVSEAGAVHPEWRVEEVGSASIANDFTKWLDGDLGKATGLSLPLTLVILLVAFGALVMSGIPVVLGIATVGSALGLWVLVSQLFPDPGMVLHLILLIGLAVGVDYSLFYMRRYREERHQGRGNVDSVKIAAATAGHSVVVSGTAVILAMTGLFVAQDAVFSSMAAGAILVVLVALVSSLTVLPALLVTLGRWVDRPRVPLLWRLSSGRRPRLVTWVVGGVVRRPVAALLIGFLALGALAAPVLGMSLKATQVADYPRELATMRAYDRLLAAFPDDANEAVVVAKVDNAAELAPSVARLRAGLASTPTIFGEVQESWVSPDGRTARVAIAVPHTLDSARAQGAVTMLRETLAPAAFGSATDVAVSGDIAADRDYTHNLEQKMPWVVVSVLLMTFGVMLFTYRSVVVGLITVALNLLSMAASFGVLVLVFQHTWAEPLLGFTSTGHIVSWVPMLLFVILTGLSLDYHVFVLSRIRENFTNEMTPEGAVLDGVARTAGVVTSAAVVMVGVFATFGALTFVELKQIGIGLAVGILLDATVIRIIVLPAMLMVSRRRLWRPAAGRPRQPAVSTPSADPAIVGHTTT